MEKIKDKELSSVQIILMGELIVNLPVLLITACTIFIATQFELGWSISVIIGVGIGWFCWGRLLKFWIQWAAKNNVNEDRLFRLGRLGLLNFNRRKTSYQ